MRIKKTIIAVFAVLSLAFLLYPGVRSLNELKDLSPGKPVQLLDGEFIRSVTSRFEEKIALQKSALSFWSKVKYRFFKEGSNGVLIGDEDWLFTTEEFDEKLDPDMTYAGFFREIEETKDFFDHEGITLIIAPVPSKSRIYRERSRRFGYSEHIENRYTDALAEFRNLEIPAPDLEFTLCGIASEEEVFYQYDTHWTGEGAARAAEALAETAEPFLGRYDFSHRSYFIDKVEKASFKGDLLSFVPPLQENREIYTRKILEDADPPSLGLFDDPVIPVILVGTSYSFDERWNFESELKLALQLDVLNLAREGAGPLEPMRELINSGYFRETGSGIVIWEIPERYIPLRQ
ncbi:MAG: hypothetical protein JXR86_10410 [Spirochaetales bacterium]|nr:hypothetical protein [Spirochaetales bacterium]